MKTLLIAFGLVVLAARGAAAGAGRELSLVLPRPLREGDRVFLEIQLGVLARGQELTLSTLSGKPLGTVSPHGIRTGSEAGTYTVPLPADIVVGNRISLRLSIGNDQRAPTDDQVKKVTVLVRGKGE